MSRIPRTSLARRSLAVAALWLCLSSSALADTLVLVRTSPSFYEPPRWSLGLEAGTPSGVTLKRYLGANALDFYLGGAYGPGLRFGADYLWGLGRLANTVNVNLDLSLGAGAFVGSLRGPCDGFFNWQGSCDGDGYVGARVPLVLELVMKGAPLAFGLEVGPGVAFAPNRAGFLLDADLAIRLLL